MSCLSGICCPFVLSIAALAVHMNSSYLCFFFFSALPNGHKYYGLYSPLGMILVTFQKTRNLPICPQMKLSPSPSNQVFHCILSLFLVVPNS